MAELAARAPQTVGRMSGDSTADLQPRGDFPESVNISDSSPLLFQGKDSWVGGRAAATSLIKDEFLAPRCYRKKGTNPLVLIGNKVSLN